MNRILYHPEDEQRIAAIPLKHGAEEDSTFRTNYRRDYGRLIHSPSFRRLQGKTQLFPWAETDFFRNRLTHSMEVAQIAKMIAVKFNRTHSFFMKKGFQIDTDIVEFSGLAHDLGHPPFGHTGEKILDQLMKEHGGFEGNAQTLRLVTKIEKRQNNCFITAAGTDERCGLNLTYRTLASILKYNHEIPYHRENEDKLVKGYYSSEKAIVKKVIQSVTGIEEYDGPFKSIECQIMDVADDIAYSTYDLEDAFKAKFICPLDCLSISDGLAQQIAEKVSENLGKPFTQNNVRDVLNNIFGNLFKPDYEVLRAALENPETADMYLRKLITVAYDTSLIWQNDGYVRTKASSELVGLFISGVRVDPNDEFPALSKVYLDDEIREQVEVLKHFVFKSLTVSPRLNIVAKRGFEIVGKIFETLSGDNGMELLPDDYKDLYQRINANEKHRIICDFIAGMTDRYAIEFYGRLTSENPETIFKPF